MIPPPSGASKTGKGRYPLSEVGAERSQPTEKRGGETDKNTEKNGSPETKGGRKTGSFRKAGCKKRAEKKVVSKEDTSSATSKPVSRKKRKKDQTLEDYLPVEKIANGIVYTTDGRYVKILEIEPINFLHSKCQRTAGHHLQLYQLLKDQPGQTPDQDDLQKSRHQ